jgi:hypothetical protein
MIQSDSKLKKITKLIEKLMNYSVENLQILKLQRKDIILTMEHTKDLTISKKQTIL